MVVVVFVAGHTGDEFFVGWSEAFFRFWNETKKVQLGLIVEPKIVVAFGSKVAAAAATAVVVVVVVVVVEVPLSSAVLSFRFVAPVSISVVVTFSTLRLFNVLGLSSDVHQPMMLLLLLSAKSLDFNLDWNFFEAFPMTKRKRIPPTETNPDRWSFALENSERRRRRWRRRKNSRARFLCSCEAELSKAFLKSSGGETELWERERELSRINSPSLRLCCLKRCAHRNGKTRKKPSPGWGGRERGQSERVRKESERGERVFSKGHNSVMFQLCLSSVLLLLPPLPFANLSLNLSRTFSLSISLSLSLTPTPSPSLTLLSVPALNVSVSDKERECVSSSGNVCKRERQALVDKGHVWECGCVRGWVRAWACEYYLRIANSTLTSQDHSDPYPCSFVWKRGSSDAL